MLIVLSQYEKKAKAGTLSKSEQQEMFNALFHCQKFISKIQKYLPEERFGKGVISTSDQEPPICLEGLEVCHQQEKAYV